jgi:acyl dehydratase
MTDAHGTPAVRRAPAHRYDDLVPGAVFESYRRTVTETDLVTFTNWAGLRLPIFIDDEHARHAGPHGGRIVPGFLTASLSAGMMETLLGPDILAGLGMDAFRFHVPVRPGDTLRLRMTVTQRRETRDPARGVVSVANEMINQRDECVLEFGTSVLMAR